MRDFKTLQVWQEAHKTTLMIYQATTRFPPDEKHGLTGQIRRASASIPANIAEGVGRGSDAEMSRFLHIAFGSANEVEYFLILARDLEILSDSAFVALELEVSRVKRMLNAFIQKLKAKG